MLYFVKKEGLYAILKTSFWFSSPVSICEVLHKKGIGKEEVEFIEKTEPFTTEEKQQILRELK